MKKFVYADNAATTRIDKEAFLEMQRYFCDDYGNASQPYSFSRNPRKALAYAREKIAKCINADPSEIFFTSGGTESDNWAIKGYSMNCGIHQTNIVTSEFEHHAVLNTCASIQNSGASVTYLKPNPNGYIDVLTLKKSLIRETGLVSIMFVNNEIGTIQPIKDLCNIAHESGYLFHTDAVQATGHIEIDVKELGIDMLSASAHKFNGPKGIGFLYIKSGIRIASLIDGGNQENGCRAGTENVASIIGMAIALENNVKAIKENEEYVLALEEHLLNVLDNNNIPFIRNGNGKHMPGNVSLSFCGHNGETILHRMDLLGCMISTGSACDGHSDKLSHVLAAIGLSEEYAKGTVRISLSKDNTFDEVEYLAKSLVNTVKSLQQDIC